MILDLNDSSIPAQLAADICIIGSGAAGITIAREFIGLPHNIIVLEAGGASFEQRSQEPYQSELLGLNHGGIHIGRARVLGGTTTLWAGQALPLTEIDFQPRDWIPHSGWPLQRKDLADYYLRAQAVMQIPAVSYDRTTWPNEKSAPPAYDGNSVITLFSQFTSTPDFARKYRQELTSAENIKLITHANAVNLQATPNADAIQEVKAKSFEGKECIVRATVFIVCCGGIESARLLLASNNVEPSGVGNRRDVVGRYFQDHPGVAIPVKPLAQRCFANWYHSFRKGNIRYAIRLASSERLQESQRILNVGAEVFYPAQQDDPLSSAKLLLLAIRKPHLISQVPAALKQVGKHPRKMIAAVYRSYVLRQPASVGNGTPHIGFACEQMPNPSSRVTLSDQIDSLGMRRTALDWKVTTLEGRSIGTFAQALLKEFKRLGVAEFNPDDLQLDGRERGENGGYIDASHHMGTTRMGTDPMTSVVDARCRAHDYQNLYIASSAVFPTGGFSNPTLTMLALCLRLSDHLKQKLACEAPTGLAASAASTSR